MAANWKMYKTRLEATEMLSKLETLCQEKKPTADREVLVFAPFTALEVTGKALAKLAETSGIPCFLGAQNMYYEAEGAFTGEISARMLLDAGVSWVLIGHSERRHVFHETYEDITRKIDTAFKGNLKVCLCVGETLEERERGFLAMILEKQIMAALENQVQNPGFLPENLAVAYEPVWAIGTGQTAKESDIAEAHTLCRSLLASALGQEKAAEITLLYGGSVKPENTEAIMAVENVNGVLVGGASLKAETFYPIMLG